MAASTDVRGVLVSGPLQNVSIQYRNRGFIADRIFPVINSPSPEAKIGRYLKGDWFRDEAQIRAPGTRSPRGTFKVDLIDIVAKEYAFAKEVTSEDRKLAGLGNTPPLQPETDAIEFCANKIDLKKERLVSAEIFSASNVWADDTGGEDAEGLWAAGASNTFIYDIEKYLDYIESTTGFRPNVLMVSGNTWKELRQETTLLGRIQYVERGIVTPQVVANLFGLDEVIIGGAIYSSAKEKKAGTEFTAARIWEKNAGKGGACLYYRPPVPGLKVPSAGMQVRVPYANGQYRNTRTWNEPAEDQDVYETKETIQILQTGSDLMKVWYDTITT